MLRFEYEGGLWGFMEARLFVWGAGVFGWMGMGGVGVGVLHWEVRHWREGFWGVRWVWLRLFFKKMLAGICEIVCGKAGEGSLSFRLCG